MLRTFFLSEIPLLNVRWKSLSVIYKMIQLVKTHDVSKLDSLFDRACCDPLQISQLKTVIRNTFTDITFWPLKTHKPRKILLFENFQISHSSHRLWENLSCWYFGLHFQSSHNYKSWKSSTHTHTQKKRCKGRCSYVPDSRGGPL